MDTREKSDNRKNPKETSSWLSLLFFGWLVPIFWKGVKRDLRITDLYDPLTADESELLGDQLEREWKKELTKLTDGSRLEKYGIKKSLREPNLLWAIVRMFWASYMLQGLMMCIGGTALQVMQPVFQGWVISYFEPKESPTTKKQALLYAALLIIVTFVVTFVYHHYNLIVQGIGMRIRVAICSLIYKKILRLNHTAMNNAAEGQVANLISNDVARFDILPLFLNDIWIMPIQVFLTGYVMWHFVGVATLVGMSAMIVQTVPVQVYFSKISIKLRAKIAAKTDQRVQMMSELIAGIQVVKMYSWEKPFEMIISRVRTLELKLIKLSSYMRGFNTGMTIISDRVTLYVTLVTFVLMGNSLTGEITFVVAGLLNVLQLICGIGFPLGIVMAGEASVSLKRITEFLLLDEVETRANIATAVPRKLDAGELATAGTKVQKEVELEMIRVTAAWDDGQVSPTLHQVSLVVGSRSLCAVVGPVSSGKSSLLHLLLGELPVRTGRLSFFTGNNRRTIITSSDVRISYASQVPWLFAASVRHNILFGQPYDERRYQEVTRVCALHKDFEELPQGDLSFVGERGASLSGGQKARVNLARAVYRDADLYLLDDPLSAVDPRVSRHLFDECITGFLKDKIRILVTHQLQYVQEADSVVVLNRGTVERQGTYEELSKSNFHLFDAAESNESGELDSKQKNGEEPTEFEDNVIHEDGNNPASTVGGDSEGCGDVTEEEIATGRMSIRVYWEYLRAGGNLRSLTLLVAIFVISQIVLCGNDYWLTHWTNEEIVRASLQLTKSTVNNFSYHNSTESFHKYHESQWFDEHGLVRRNLAICVYTVCISGGVILIILGSILFMKMSMKASCNIHDSMFANLLRTTMRFFNTNPSGRILNRFSKDMGAMDELLPNVILDALQILIVMVGLLMMIIIVNTWMIIPAVLLAGLFYLISIHYLKTEQNLNRLEGIAKSPVFSHISSTLDGITTIRSRGVEVEGLLKREFDRHQDTHTGAWYLSIASSNAFGLLLDCIVIIFVACVCFSFILMDDGHILGGSVGLAISQAIMLTGLVQYGAKQATAAVSRMTSVERVLQYTRLPKERSLTSDNPPPPSWPSEGGLIFKDVTMRYAENKPPVLKMLNVTISPGWKVGIVGRTGAGKSSLISALFRLTGEGLEGEIILDGIDTGCLGLHELRPRISIIPQEPILFSATLRYNLDPFDEYDDPRLWETLQEVELGNAVPSLDFQVAGGGANFSVGQRQLICLARAILRNNKVLVLDEATANVDPNTDAFIQNTIRRRFADCTVLTIAHRLNTIIDSDRVMVMAEGRIVEFDHPYLLLKNSDGYFSQMLEQTGNVMAEKLTGIAKEAFRQSPEFVQELNQGTAPPTNNTNNVTRL